MALTEFYEFSWRKVIITIVLFLAIGLYLILFGSLFVTDTVPPTSSMILLYIFFWPTLILASLFGMIFERSTTVTDVPLFILAVIINGFYFYTLGCVIDLVIENIKSK